MVQFFGPALETSLGCMDFIQSPDGLGRRIGSTLVSSAHSAVLRTHYSNPQHTLVKLSAYTFASTCSKPVSCS